MKQLFIGALALVAIVALSACNTIRGMGRDVESVGRGVERASQTR